MESLKIRGRILTFARMYVIMFTVVVKLGGMGYDSLRGMRKKE